MELIKQSQTMESICHGKHLFGSRTNEIPVTKI
jgi:hypothetical protein